MEKTILLHQLSPEDFKQIIREVFKDEFVAVKKELYRLYL